MLISSFYAKTCEKEKELKSLVSENGRSLVLFKACEMFAALVHTGKGDTVGSIIGQFLEEEYKKIPFSFEWMPKQYALDDTAKFTRLADYLSSLQPVSVMVATNYTSDTVTLDGMVSLVMQDEDDVYHGICICPYTSKRSMSGRSYETRATDSLETLVGLYTLSQKYDGPFVMESLYLTQKNDAVGSTANFLIGGCAGANCYQMQYPEYQEDNVVDLQLLSARIEEICLAKKESKTDCSDCSYKCFCKIPDISGLITQKSVQKNSKPTYVFPKQFTASQLEAIHHVNGPMLVCAGPGSGKTAAIIGRIRYLVEECHIPPQFILVVTFTNLAVNELKERCLSFLEEGNLPVIQTINGFAYSILRDNSDLLPRELNVLTESKQLDIVKTIVHAIPCIPGIKYGKENGEHGLYKTLVKKLNDYLESTPEQFYFQNGQIGQTEFDMLVQMYQEIVDCNGYISFDEQITMANQLLETRQDVLRNYQAMFHYIMVDEFQDTSYHQARMLYMLAASRKNILAVGDDDQSIYAFRGADLKYNMLGFPKMYPNCKTVVFRENFRSTEAIVSSAVSLINNNKERISKDIISGRSVKGELPKLVQNSEIATVDAAIEAMLQRGYSYQDIAIISSTNSALETLHSELRSPNKLAKCYLIYDGLFLFAMSVLMLHANVDDNVAMYRYASLFGKQELLLKKGNGSIYHTILDEYGYRDIRSNDVAYMNDGIFGLELSILADMFSILDTNPSLQIYLDACVAMLHWEESDARDVLLDLAEKQNISSLDQFLRMMQTAVEFSDSRKVETAAKDQVVLLTSHDAKGKEYPVVFIYDRSKVIDEETRRVYYVTLTRGKDLCVVFQGSNKVDFMEEVPHTIWEVA